MFFNSYQPAFKPVMRRLVGNKSVLDIIKFVHYSVSG